MYRCFFHECVESKASFHFRGFHGASISLNCLIRQKLPRSFSLVELILLLQHTVRLQPFLWLHRVISTPSIDIPTLSRNTQTAYQCPLSLLLPEFLSAGESFNFFRTIKRPDRHHAMEVTDSSNLVGSRNCRSF